MRRTFDAGGLRVTAAAEAFNVFDGDAVLERYRNAASPLFDQPTRWMLPRIVRVGLRATF